MSMTNCVFIVDDDPSARKGLARLLRTAGHDVRDFASVNEFLNTLGLEVSGCVILDGRVPGLSGEELLTGLKANGIHLPIIVVTADDDPETRSRARKMKAAGFFRKPVDGKALLDAVEWALRSSREDKNNHKA